MTTLAALLSSLPQQGELRWIGLRPARIVPMVSVTEVIATAGGGLAGDRFSGGAQSKRQVTLIQQEHLSVLGQLLGRAAIEPMLLRRNLVISGINLLALQRAEFQIGEVILQGTASVIRVHGWKRR